MRYLGLLSIGLLLASCTSRLYTNTRFCEAGLRLDTEAAEFTFSKNQVLQGAKKTLKRLPRDQKAWRDLSYLSAWYAADTTRLLVIPELLPSALLNERNVNGFLLFTFIDRTLMKEEFCIKEKQTGRYAPWVKRKRYKKRYKGKLRIRDIAFVSTLWPCSFG